MSSSLRSLLSSALFVTNVLVSLCLILATMAAYIDPRSTAIPALFGLAFPFLFIANVSFLVFWLIKKRKYLLLSLACTFLSLPTAFNFIALNTTTTTTNGAPKLLSFNVRNFDLYNWSSNKTTRNRIFDFLKAEQAEIVCLQEFFNSTSRNDDFITLDTILTFQKAKNYHVEYTSTAHVTQNWGIVTFSSFPIVNKGSIRFESKTHNVCIFTDLKIGLDTIRVYNMHLASIHFQQSDYRFMDSLSNKNNQEQINGSINLLKKLKRAFVKRAEQSQLILKSIQSSPYPVVVCGDFNDTPSSYTYKQLTSNLMDAFLASGNGLGKTYVGSFPSFRIDFILHDKAITSWQFNTHQEQIISDHYPISTYLSLKQN
jgi:endonuclease/exonuclease/phosphatase family metal-dependent hydrolase